MNSTSENVLSKRALALSPETTVELLTDDHGHWLGLGQVTIHAVPLRDASSPILPRLESDDGIMYTQYRIREVLSDAQGTTITLDALGQAWPRQVYLDDYQQSQIHFRSLATRVVDRATLTLRPVTRSFAGYRWSGLEWSFSFASDERRVHRLLWHASWAIGGRLTGNTVLHQGNSNPPVFVGTKDAVFSTACPKTMALVDDLLGQSFQLAPRIGFVQAFDLQFGPQGTLLHTWPKLDNIVSLLESPAGVDDLVVIDQHHFALTHRFATAPQQILFAPPSLSLTEAKNLWWRLRDEIHRGIRGQWGIKSTRPQVTDAHDLHHAKWEAGRTRVLAGDKWVAPEETSSYVADTVLPKLAAQGVKAFHHLNIHVSDITEFSSRRKLDIGFHGGIMCSSICSIHEHFPSPFWGGLDGYARVARRAHELGMKIKIGFFPYFSPRAAIFQQHPDWLMRQRDGLIDDGSYGDAVGVVDWQSGIFQWTLDQLRDWHQQGGGIDSLFVHNYPYQCLLTQNYAEDLRGNFNALHELFREIQGLGIEALVIKGVSAMGPAQIPMADFDVEAVRAKIKGASLTNGVDLARSLEGVYPPSNLVPWVDHVDMMVDFGPVMLRYSDQRPNAESDRIYFQALANRACLTAPHREQPFTYSEAQASLHRSYHHVLPRMCQRTLLDNNRGVLWQSDEGSVLWTYTAIPAEVVGDVHVIEVANGDERAVDAGSRTFEPYRIYQFPNHAVNL